jgi:hypothetical protein
MTYLRHSSRQAHQSVIDYITNGLDALGWTDPDNTPFGATTVAILDGFPDEFDETKVLDPGMMVITIGDEDSAREEELGALKSIEIPIFIDCFQDTDGIALALACDVRDILEGRFQGTLNWSHVYDYTNGEPFPSGYTVEFEDTTRERIKNRWHVIKTSAIMFFNDVRQEPEDSS